MASLNNRSSELRDSVKEINEIKNEQNIDVKK